MAKPFIKHDLPPFGKRSDRSPPIFLKAGLENMNRTRFKVTDCPKSIYFMDVQILQIMGRQMNRNPTPAFLSMRGTSKNGGSNAPGAQHQPCTAFNALLPDVQAFFQFFNPLFQPFNFRFFHKFKTFNHVIDLAID